MKLLSIAFLTATLALAAPIAEPCNESGLCLRRVPAGQDGDFFAREVDSRAAPTPAEAPPATPSTKAPTAPAKTTKASTPPAKSSKAAAPPAKSTAKCSSSANPNVNAATVNLIKSFEGFVKSPAPDPIGLPTVGFGHLCKQKNCAEVPFKFPLSEANAASLLQTDLKSFTKCVADAVSDKVVLNDNQFGALASFTFNLGCGAFKSSTMLKRLNGGENPNTVAGQEMPKFNHAGGKVLAGLTRRRNAEVKLFKTASSKVAHPPCK